MESAILASWSTLECFKARLAAETARARQQAAVRYGGKGPMLDRATDVVWLVGAAYRQEKDSKVSGLPQT